MSARPQPLFPLFASLETLPGIGPKSTQLLQNMGITVPRDLLFLLPTSGIDRRVKPTIEGEALPATLTVRVTVERHLPPRSNTRPYRVDVSDANSAFQLVFFRPRAQWITAQLPIGSTKIVSGKVELFDGIAQMPHPDYILSESEAASLPEFEPIYPLTQGITQKAMRRAASGAVVRAPDLAEWIDASLVKKENWPSWHAALVAAHAPTGSADIAEMAPSRRRLAYDELFAHQLSLALIRQDRRKRRGRPSTATGRLQSKVLNALSFRPTGAQERAIREITQDMAAQERMNRLLQGDVGAGKTLVALMALLVAVESGGQGVMMAPTEILARQHLLGLAPLAESAGVVLEILTGRDRGAERAAKLRALRDGRIQILVGTHAVFQKDVEFQDLRLVVIDEQHRFGVAQRMELGKKGETPDVLVMTATPIPRSLSLAQYGHMDLSILDEKPPGRTPVKTAMVSADRLDDVVDHLKTAISQGRQAYWVCPLVDESETTDLTAAEERFKMLRSRLGEGHVGLVHGQMPPAEKDAAMARFVRGETKVLVATTVIEVGVDVPNASIMVIERAEFFGLSQLHQLRGRVGRGAEASTCLLMYQPPLGQTARRRLELMRETDDGFRIAEEDLAMRGAGDIIGTAQSGLPKFRIADLERHVSLQAVARDDARRLLDADPRLTSERGKAARALLWLLEHDKAIDLISVG